MIILYAKYRHFVNVICSFFQRVKYNILFFALHSFLHSPTARPSMRTSFMASAMRIMEGKAGFSARSSIWSANRKTRFRVASPSIRTAATSWVCNPARKVVQYDCRFDCIHFCGQADLWKRSRCWRTGGVFLFIPVYYSYSGCIANKASADCPRSSSPPWIPAQCGRFPAAGAARPQ